ncbi:MAG: hypothetical protein IJ287_05135, partial [Methanobrevibacter sp.]|nr:hypothetical protein [Methanobrevibacter sp.]
MKINKFLLVGIFLLAIISLGAVSAAEDAGNATAIDNGDILMESSVNDDVISEDSEGVISDDGELEDSGARISTMTTAFVKGDDDASFTFEIPQYDVDGNIYVYLDSKDNKVFEKEAESWDNEIYYNNFIDDSLSFGTHTIFVEYKDSSYYLPVQENFTFDYNYYSLTVYEDAYLGPNHDNYIRAYFPYDVAGRFILKVDGKVIVDSDEDGMDSNYAIELDQFACGNHTWNAEYSNGNYEPFKKSGTFTLGYDIEMWCDNEWEVEYGDDFIIHIGGPSTLESVVLEYDGKSKTVPLEYGSAEVNINDCGLGEHTITVKVLKSDMFYAGEETATLNVIAKCGFDYSGNRIRYNSDDGLYFRLPSDAKGTLLITVDEKDNITADLKNGVAKIPLADYSLGSHSIEVRYDDGKYSVSKEMDFNVVPNVKYEYYMLNGTDNVISIELPDDATGTFRVSSDDYYVLDKTVDIVNGHASITLPPFMSTFDEDIYLYWECDGDDYFYDDIAIRPMFDPASTQINISGSNKFIKGEYGNYITISHALNANGRINVSIDGKQMDTIDFGGDNSFEIYVSEYFEDLALGSHKIRVDYYGDKYFEDSSKEITVELIPLSINIPANFVLGLDSVYIRLSNDADGYAIVYVNGSEYAKRNVDFHENGRYINVPLEDLKLNEVYDIKVVYTNDSNIDEVTKSATIKTDYDFEIEGTGTLYYGDENIIRAYFFSPMQGDVTLKIADKTYTKALDGSEVLFNLSDVDLGEYEITVTFDGKGISSKSHSDTVYVEPHIDFNSGNIIDESTVSLNLPADATGSLQIYVYDEDDNLVKNVSQHMKNGDALITFNLKKLGEYRYQAEYDGDDYIVEESTGSFTLRPKISVNSSVYIGEKNPLTFEMPSDAKGTLTVKYGNMEIPCEFINGKASVMLPAWDIEDELLLSIRYSDDVYGNFGFGWDDEIYVYINKLDSALNLTVPENISAGETVSI